MTTDKEDTGKNYIGLTEGTFKQRYTQHLPSFHNKIRQPHRTSKTHLENQGQQ